MKNNHQILMVCLSTVMMLKHYHYYQLVSNYIKIM